MKGLAIAGAGFVLMLGAEGAAMNDAPFVAFLPWLLAGMAIFAAGFAMMGREDRK